MMSEGSSIAAGAISQLPPQHVEAAPPASENKAITRRYAIALAVGLVPVFLSGQLWWTAAAVMGWFLWRGYGDAVKSGMVYEFADSFYYLGFTLSVGSLLAALDPFHVTARPDVVRTFHQFGLGMFTTLFGVAGRTVLQTYHRLPTETLESINRQIAEQGQKYLSSLTELNSRTSSLLGESFDEYKSSVTEPLDRLAKAVHASNDVIEKTQAQAATLRQVTEASAKAIETAKTTATEGLSDLARNAKTAGDLMTELAAALGQAKSGERTVVEAVKGFGQAITTTTAAVADDVKKLAAASIDLTATSRSLKSAADAVEQADLETRLVTLQASIETVASSAKAQGEAIATQADSMEKQLGASNRAAKELNAALDEIVLAATQKLERLS